LFIDGSTDSGAGADATSVIDDSFLILVNVWWEPLTFTVSAEPAMRRRADDDLAPPAPLPRSLGNPPHAGRCRRLAYGRCAGSPVVRGREIAARA
jgi:hypothetical protein